MTVVMVEDLDSSSADAGVAAHYGDPMREQRTLATAVGLVDRSNRDVIAVPGEERASWLHTLTTQHLSDLSENEASELLVLSPHGHVEQHAYVTEDGTTAWLDTEPGAGAGLLKYLEMMRFFTKVEPRDASDEIAVLSLVGPGAADLFPDLARRRRPRRCRARSSLPARCRPRPRASTPYANSRAAWPAGSRWASTCSSHAAPRRP